ncbi:hypothetical protein SUGI_0277060 [Cryptomeria japonica]|nr:hypothetical protein SUGI_0277060 [Cryptomeria japonica]
MNAFHHAFTANKACILQKTPTKNRLVVILNTDNWTSFGLQDMRLVPPLGLLAVVVLGTCIRFLWLNAHDQHQRICYTGALPESSSIRPRRAFKSYSEYIQLQLNKTLNPRLREVWTTRDWGRKVEVFSGIFGHLRKQGVVGEQSKALCIGARVGQEVAALKAIGVEDAIGIDLVPFPPLVLSGDMHSHPFQDDTFDFEFSNAFDHALYPTLFVSEMERTLKPGGVAVVHVSAHRRGDKYSVNDLFSPAPFIALFKRSSLVHVRKVDAFGLDTEIILRKNSSGIVSPIVKEAHLPCSNFVSGMPV